MGKLAVFTFGRFQPVHKNHGMLIQKVIDVAKERDGIPFIFTSQKHNDFEDYKKAKTYMNSKEFKTMTQNMFPVKPDQFISTKHNENPLKPKDKIAILHKLYDDLFKNIPKPCCIVDDIIQTPFNAIHNMKDKGFTKFVMIVGEDRENSFRTMFEKYDEYDVEVIGLPRPEHTYSGTKLRHMAIQDNRDGLKEAMGNKMTNEDIDLLIHKIKEGVTVPEKHRSRYMEESMRKNKTRKQSRATVSTPENKSRVTRRRPLVTPEVKSRSRSRSRSMSRSRSRSRSRSNIIPTVKRGGTHKKLKKKSIIRIKTNKNKQKQKQKKQ